MFFDAKDFQVAFAGGVQELGEGGAAGSVGVGEEELGVHGLEALGDAADVLAGDAAQYAEEVAAWIAGGDGAGELSCAVAVVRGVQDDRRLVAKHLEARAQDGRVEMRWNRLETKYFNGAQGDLEILL